MAMSGKKGKKTKGKTLNLQDFLSGESGGAATGSLVTKNYSWANECEDDDYAPPKIVTYSIPTAPRSMRVLDDSTIPQNSPFLAYMSNLPYDLNEQDIQEYFEEETNFNVVSVRLPREDGDSGRMRGFGYIEFAEREGLIAAVSLPDPQLRNRKIRIDVSTEQDQKRGGGNRGRYDNFGASSENRDTNWRRGDGNRQPDNGDSVRRGGFGYNRERPREPSQEGGNWRSGDRPKADSPPPRRDREMRDGRDRDGGRDGRDRDMGRDGRDRDMGRDGRDRDGGRDGRDRYGGRRNNEFEDRPKREEVVLEERPRLKLQPRTLPMPELKPQDDEVEDAAKSDVEKVSRPKPVPAAAIFGSAKPVDTAAKDRAIEERLEKERLQKIKDAEEKAKLEQERKEAEPDAAEKTDEETKEDAPIPVAEKTETFSWRRKTEEGDEPSRTQSPPRRRYSPDRRQRRQNDDRRSSDERRGPRDNNRRDQHNNRDKRDFNRDQQRNDRDYKGDSYNRDRNYNRGDKPDRNQQRDEISRGPPRDDRDNKPRRLSATSDDNIENKMPKYKPDVKPKLQIANTYGFLEDEAED